MTAQPVMITGSLSRLIDSQSTGRQYQITISLPLGYHKSPTESWPFNDTPSKWPVIYVLDGNWYAAMVTGIVRPMAWCGSTTDAIVVGIGYPEAEDPIEAFRVAFTRRDYDLTPVYDEAVEKSMRANHNRPVPNGDAANFLRFIETELVPSIEHEFRADPANRILVGHSYGGLFALQAMYEAPDLFQCLIIGSPTLSYGNRWIVAREEMFAKANKQLPATLYLFAGEHEESVNDTTLTDTLRLAAILQGRSYEGFSLTKAIFADQNHCEVAAPGIQWGLKSALQRGK